MTKPARSWKWIRGNVDRSRPHIELRFGDAGTSDYDSWIPIAIIGEPIGHCFSVQWIVDENNPKFYKIINQTRHELNFYLVELPEEDHWTYAKHHCNTAANMYSNIHWSYFPEGEDGERHSSKVIHLCKVETNKPVQAKDKPKK